MQKNLVALVFAAGLAAAAFAEQADPNRFHSPTAGVAFRKPASWMFAPVDAVQANREKVRLADSELEKLVQERASLPLAAAMRHPEPYPDLNPSFQVGLRPLGNLAEKSADQIIKLLLPNLVRVGGDGKVVRPVEKVTISGLPAARAAIEYTLRTADGGAFPTRSEIIVVPRGKFMFMIGAGRKPDDSATAKEIEDILASMVIDR